MALVKKLLDGIKSNLADVANSANAGVGANSAPAPTTRSATPEKHAGGQVSCASFVDNESIVLEQGLHDRAKLVAVRSGARESEPVTQDALMAEAERAAHNLTVPRYDPQNNPADASREREQERLRGQRDEAEIRLNNAKASLHSRRHELDELGTRPEQPEFPLALALVADAAISITLTFSLHDLFFTKLFDTRAQALLVSFVAGALIAGLVVHGQLGSAKSPDESTLARLVWMAVGPALGVGLYVLRLSSVQGFSEHLLAIGLSVVEIVCAAIVDVYANGYRRHWKAFRQRQDQFAGRERAVETDTARCQTIERDIATIDGQIDEHIQQVALRQQRADSVDRRIAAARAAAASGYLEGIAENRGYYYGHHDASYRLVEPDRGLSAPKNGNGTHAN